MTQDELRSVITTFVGSNGGGMPVQPTDILTFVKNQLVAEETVPNTDVRWLPIAFEEGVRLNYRSLVTRKSGLTIDDILLGIEHGLQIKVETKVFIRTSTEGRRKAYYTFKKLWEISQDGKILTILDANGTKTNNTITLA